jgi:arginyl-tRNA synthetase
MNILMFDKVKKELSTLLLNAINTLSANKEIQIDPIEQLSIYNQISDAPNFSMGHYCFGAFQLAKPFKSNPAALAGELSSLIKDSDYVAEIKATGPYINFKLNYNTVGNEVINEILSDKYFNTKLIENTPKTMVEYSQPNTHKEMHVGHMRNLCLGNAVIKMLQYASHEVISSTYPGDVGTHVAKCLWYLDTHIDKNEWPTDHKGKWLGKLYSKANNLLEDQLGSEHEEKNRTELTEILKQIHSGSGKFFDLWKETRQWSIDLMKEVYSWSNVEFDHWYFESMVDFSSVELVKKHQKSGLFIESEGAVGIDLEDYKLGFCLLLKSDGNGLYSTKDLELARIKFDEFQIEQSIYIVDSRQERHFKQVFKTLELMGFESAKNCYHLKYEFVELPDGAMSSRKGTQIPLQDLIDQMQDHIKIEYLSKYSSEWKQSEIDDVAQVVAEGAIKYGMTRMDNNKKIVFEMKEWLKLDGESGPYIQYVYARIQSILEKVKVDGIPNYNVLESEAEKKLMFHLLNFNSVVTTAAIAYKTSSICSYLYELAKLFNSFYADHSISKAESEELKIARWHLSSAVAITISNGLNLLGIRSPKRM